MEKEGWNDDVANEELEHEPDRVGRKFSEGALETHRSGSRDQGANGYLEGRDNLELARGDSRNGSLSLEGVRATHATEPARPRTDPRFDPRMKEIQRLEDQMSGCSNAVKKMQLRRDISSLRAQMGGQGPR